MAHDHEKHIHSLEQMLADLTIENQKLREDYSKMSKDQIEEINKEQLKEMAHWYGSWAELRKVIDTLEDNANEAAYERRTSGEPDAWSGGFADNH
jgi:hypothetical protein